MIETPHSLRDCAAPAKLNLFLHITGRRPDGYHALQTVFQLIDWGDVLHFTLRQDGEVHRKTEVPGVPEASDLVVRAAALLKAHTGTTLGVDIEIEKRLPMGAGLGGGSSDAATTLLALNRLWKLNLARDVAANFGIAARCRRAVLHLRKKCVRARCRRSARGCTIAAALLSSGDPKGACSDRGDFFRQAVDKRFGSRHNYGLSCTAKLQRKMA